MRTFGITVGVFGTILLAFGNDWGLIGLVPLLILQFEELAKDTND
jgi:hypothetical protein